MRQKVYNYQQEIIAERKLFNIVSFRAKWFGINEKIFNLLEVFKHHNDQMQKLIGSDFSKATLGKYRSTYDHTMNFLKWKYNQTDITVTSNSYQFITDFELYMKTQQRRCNHNTTIKYLTNLRKTVNTCIKNGWLIKDPFFGFKMSKKEVIRDFLSEEE